MTSLEILTSHFGSGFLLCLIYASWLLRILSRRMGEVTKMHAYYRGFDIGNALLLVALLSYLLQCSAALPNYPQGILTFDFSLTTLFFPLTLGIGVNLITALIYWGWLVKGK